MQTYYWKLKFICLSSKHQALNSKSNSAKKKKYPGKRVVAHAHNSVYNLGGRDQEDCGLRASQGKKWDLISISWDGDPQPSRGGSYSEADPWQKHKTLPE
jgi:hypothetical protein